MSTQIVKQFDLSPQNFEQAIKFADYLAESDLVPKDFKNKPSNCLIAMQWGAEVGLKPLQAIQNIAVINGRPALWGDAVIALVRSSHLCEYIIETDDGNMASCRVKRKGEHEQVRTFSMQDAQRAGLSGRQGPWSQYPQRMRQMRARAFALRDVFPDLLRGIDVAEEAMDIQTEKHMGEAEVVSKTLEVKKYPDDEFQKNIIVWTKAIQDGRVDADGVIARASTKGELSEEQKSIIRSKSKLDDTVVKLDENNNMIIDHKSEDQFEDAPF